MDRARLYFRAANVGEDMNGDRGGQANRPMVRPEFLLKASAVIGTVVAFIGAGVKTYRTEMPRPESPPQIARVVPAPTRPPKSAEELSHARLSALVSEAERQLKGIDDEYAKGLGVTAAPNGLVYRIRLKTVRKGETLDSERCEVLRRGMLPEFCGKKADLRRDFGENFAARFEYVNQADEPVCTLTLSVSECK